MKIFVKAKPGSKKAEIKKIDDINYMVAVKERPVKGKANAAILRALSKYFDVPLSRLRMVAGTTSRQKVIEIN